MCKYQDEALSEQSCVTRARLSYRGEHPDPYTGPRSWVRSGSGPDRVRLQDLDLLPILVPVLGRVPGRARVS